MLSELPTPALLVDRERLQGNLRRMQAVANTHGVALWPHIKTHKTVEIARMQLAAGAAGLTCAKIGEAEAMLPSGVRCLFIAYSLVDPRQGPRLRALADRLDQLIVAVTSASQAEALDALLAPVDLTLPVLMAVDTGLGREGVRTAHDAARLAALVDCLPHLNLMGLYTHEGQSYSAPDPRRTADEAHARLLAARDAVDPALPLWPGASPTAARSAALPGVAAVRPGAYVFGDLSLAGPGRTMAWDDIAFTVLTTVVDRPTADLALLDAGSKTLSGDRAADGRYASLFDGRAIHVARCSEEHGWATGPDVDTLRLGDRIRLVPAHVCPAVNLADELVVLDSEGSVTDRWKVAARGRVQ